MKSLARFSISPVLGGLLCALPWLATGNFMPVERSGREVHSLNEGWKSTLTPEKGTAQSRTGIDLPHNWDDYYGFRQQFHGNLHGSASYERSFNLSSLHSRRAFLVFEGAGSYLTVSLNGHTVCRRKPAGRLVTTLEVTDVIRCGENLLRVVCDHPSEIKDMPWICGGCSGCECESPEPIGLFRDVSLVLTGSVRIAPFGLHVWSDGDCTTCHVEVELDCGRNDRKDFAVRVRAPELAIDETIDAPRSPVVTRQYALGAVKRWSVGQPNLYAVTVDVVGSDGCLLDTETVRTGFRTIHWPFHGESDHRFFLNGKPTFVHGTAEIDHRLGGSMAFEPEEISARVDDIRRLGFNVFREGHEPHDRRFGEALESSGIMWWPGFSTHAYFDTPQFRTHFLAAVEQWVRERRNSPAVVIWGLQNESTLPKEFAEDCVRLIRRLDPMAGPAGRPVVTCNWGAGTDWNVYQNWTGTYAGMGGTLMTYEKDLAKPEQLLNGEYGAWRSAGFHTDPDAPWDIKGPWSEEHAARILYEKLMRGWSARDRVAGQCLWIWMSHENPGRDCRVEEGYREIDKLGPVNFKGLYTIWGQRTAAWYLYYAYGRHLSDGTLDGHLKKPLSWWIAEGKRLNDPPTVGKLVPMSPEGLVCIRRFNCGGDRLTDSCGHVWEADDTRFVTSWADDRDLAVEGFTFNPVMASQMEVDGDIKNVGAADAAIFRTMRYGRRRLRLSFPAPTNAPCRVEMYFVEPGSYGRVFDIAINGQTVERDFTLSNWAPERHVVRRFWDVKASAHGRLEISFPRVAANQAIVSAVAIYTAADVAAPAKDPEPAGYPACDGLTWRELTARVRHKTPERLLPFQGKIGVGAPPSQAFPDEDKDGWHRAKFCLYTAANYTVRFRVLGGNPRGKKLVWRFMDAGYKWTVAEGEMTIDAVGEDGMVTLPIGSYINAGYYAILFKGEGVEISPREMVWK